MKTLLETYEPVVRNMLSSIPKSVFTDADDRDFLGAISSVIEPSGLNSSWVLDLTMLSYVYHGKHAYQLDVQLGEALAKSTPKTETFELQPLLPFSHIFVEFPPSLCVLSDVDGTLTPVDAGGVFITASKFLPTSDGRIIKFDSPVIAFLRVYQHPDAGPGDCTAAPEYYVFQPGEPYWVAPDTAAPQTQAVAKFVYNLLYVLQRAPGYLQFSARGDAGLLPGAPRHLRREAERALKKGKSQHPYTLITLSERAKQEQDARKLADTDDDTAARTPRVTHLVAGHFRTYWVKDPDGAPVMDTKQGPNGMLYAVVRWLLPFQRGVGEPVIKPKLVIP